MADPHNPGDHSPAEATNSVVPALSPAPLPAPLPPLLPAEPPSFVNPAASTRSPTSSPTPAPADPLAPPSSFGKGTAPSAAPDLDPSIPTPTNAPPAKVESTGMAELLATIPGRAAPPEAKENKAAGEPGRSSIAVAAAVVVVAGLFWSLVRGGADDALYSRYSLREKARLSADWRDNASAKGELLGNPRVVGAVSSVGETISRSPTAGVLVTREPGVRVFALADGVLVISVGALEKLHSEAELAAALAHAHAHFALGHDEVARNDAAAGTAATAGDGANHGHHAEAAADAVALEVLKASGWNGAALSAAFTALASDAGWSARHPLNDDRAGRLSAAQHEGRDNAPEYTQRVLERLRSPATSTNNAPEEPTAPAAFSQPYTQRPKEPPIDYNTVRPVVED